MHAVIVPKSAVIAAILHAEDHELTLIRPLMRSACTLLRGRLRRVELAFRLYWVPVIGLHGRRWLILDKPLPPAASYWKLVVEIAGPTVVLSGHRITMSCFVVSVVAVPLV